MPSVEERLEAHMMTKRVAPDATGEQRNLQHQGVSVAWLAQAFDLEQSVVKRRLKNCPPKTVKRRGTKMLTVLYDLKDAAPFLVEPAFSTKDYLRAAKRNMLPPALQQQVWDALLKRQKWEENAGQLWRTGKIREVLGSTFQTIKFTMQLWPETLERQVEVTNEQRELLVEMVDMLQRDIYEKLVAAAADGGQGPQLDEMEALVGESESVVEIVSEVDAEEDFDEDDFDNSDLI